MRICLLLILIFVVNFQNVYADESTKSICTRMFSIFDMLNTKQQQKKLISELSSYIDFATMAKDSIGQSNWEKLNNVQKVKYTQLFEKLIENKFYPRFHKFFCDTKLEFIKEIKVQDEIFVKTILKEPDDSNQVTWKFKNTNGQIKLISLAYNDRDLINSLSKKLTNKFNKLGYDKFIKQLSKYDDDVK